MSTIQIKPEFLHALSTLHKKSFTVAELTDHYLSHPQCLHKAKKPARQFVYRNMVRLMNAELMEKLRDDRGWPRYHLTAKFNTLNSEQVAATASSSSKTTLITKPATAATNKPMATLRERLSHYRSDMLCALGEAEEYESLCKELPVLSNEAQSLYTEARERSALLLGKIKALESLISSTSLR